MKIFFLISFDLAPFVNANNIIIKQIFVVKQYFVILLKYDKINIYCAYIRIEAIKMFKKLKRTKVFRDPLYGYIQVDYKIISDLIDSREVQRLRRIRQLSGVSMVFQTAEHTRFTHSLGVYQMANLVSFSFHYLLFVNLNMCYIHTK